MDRRSIHGRSGLILLLPLLDEERRVTERDGEGQRVTERDKEESERKRGKEKLLIKKVQTHEQ
jgi:hypothetical protein